MRVFLALLRPPGLPVARLLVIRTRWLHPEALLQHFAQLRRADLLEPAAAQLLCRRYI